MNRFEYHSSPLNQASRNIISFEWEANKRMESKRVELRLGKLRLCRYLRPIQERRDSKMTRRNLKKNSACHLQIGFGYWRGINVRQLNICIWQLTHRPTNTTDISFDYDCNCTHEWPLCGKQNFNLQMLVWRRSVNVKLQCVSTPSYMHRHTHTAHSSVSFAFSLLPMFRSTGSLSFTTDSQSKQTRRAEHNKILLFLRSLRLYEWK